MKLTKNHTKTLQFFPSLLEKSFNRFPFYLSKIKIPTLLFLALLFSYPFFLLGNKIQINYIQYNDSSTINKDLIHSTDTLILPALQEMEVHLLWNQLDKTDTLFYKFQYSDSRWNKTIYPLIRYTNIQEGHDNLLIYSTQSIDTFLLPIQCGQLMEQGFSGMIHEKEAQTIWWFPPLLTFCLMLIPFTIVYFLTLDRSRRNLRVEVIRNQIASDLHDDVGVNLSAIKNFTEMFLSKNTKDLPEQKVKIMERIKRYTDETLNKLQDTVWAINPSHDSIEELLAKMKDFALEMIPAKGIKLQYTDNSQQQHLLKLDMPQRHSMFLMYKEAINNIVKHSKANAVNITISNSKKTLSIDIKDDGIGFDSTIQFAGNGLKNFKNRATENFIDFDLKSSLKEGTQIKMVVYSL